MWDLQTEVAIRAAFAAAAGQVAVVVPTTLLASNITAIKRLFDGTGIRVEHISPVTASAQAKENIERSHSQIVVGTLAFCPILQIL